MATDKTPLQRVICRACGQWWTVDGEAGSADLGRGHHCPEYLGPESERAMSTLKVDRVRHIPDTKPHPCNSDCEMATGTVCHCECGGHNHGRAHLRQVPPALSIVTGYAIDGVPCTREEFVRQGGQP